jgi:transcriptional regulator with XRE-family HTH domain
MQDPRQQLAERLRWLREHALGLRRITQPELAQALGDGKSLSVPLISSWESQTNPRIPPMARVEAYAALFGAPRSFDLRPPRPLGLDEMTDEERRSVSELTAELTQLRQGALRATALPVAGMSQPRVSATGPSVEPPLAYGPLWFPDGKTITIVCGQWPQEMLEQVPYTDVNDPDYIELLQYSDLDALLELHGHLRAANPSNQVNYRIAGKLSPDDYHSHLVLLGGVDWNKATTNVLARLQLPVRQVADWSKADGQYFEVDDANEEKVKHHARLERKSDIARSGHRGDGVGDKGILLEDIALFARAVNPLNRKRTVTICHGMYGRGTYGAVRALTDANFRDRNADYVRARFGGSETYCILMRVPILDGATLTPDWTLDQYTLFEWSG